MLSVAILFLYRFSVLERFESVTFFLPRHCPAVLIIFAGPGGSARVSHGAGLALLSLLTMVTMFSLLSLLTLLRLLSLLTLLPPLALFTLLPLFH